MSDSEFLNFDKNVEFVIDELEIQEFTEKFNKYQLPFKPPTVVSHKIKSLAEHQCAKNPVRIILSDKQRDEILDKGKMKIKLKFSCIGVFNIKGKSHLTFRILGMKKLESNPVELTADDF